MEILRRDHQYYQWDYESSEELDCAICPKLRREKYVTISFNVLSIQWKSLVPGVIFYIIILQRQYIMKTEVHVIVI